MKPETQLQIDLVKWMKETYPTLLFTSTQAGDRRNKVAAMMMKRMGYRNGTPDLLILKARNCYHGFLLELKDIGGIKSDDQIEFMKKATAEGYLYEFAYGIDQAKDAIQRYMGH